MLSKKSIFFVLSGIVLLAWLYFLNKYALNFPRTADDIRFFITQFNHGYISESSFIDKLQYLGMISNWPHTKIVGRILQMVQYELAGSINFRQVVLLGNLIYIILVYLFVRFSKENKATIFLLFSFWLFVPIFNSYWPIFSVSFAGNLCFSLLVLWSAMHNKWIYFVPLAIGSVFVHGHLAVLPFIGIGLLLTYNYIFDKNGLRKREWATVIIVLILTVVLFYFHIIESPMRRASQELGSDVSILPKLGATIMYVVSYCTRTITSLLFGASYNTQGLILALPLFGYAIFLIVRALRKGDKFQYLLVGMLTLCVISALTAGWVRNDGLSYFPSVAPRYECWSILFLALLIVLSFVQWRHNKIVALLLIALSAGIYIGRMAYEIPKKASIPKQRITFLGDMIGEYANLSSSDQVISQRIKESIRDGMYKPDLHICKIPTQVKAKDVSHNADSKMELIKFNATSAGSFMTVGCNEKVYPPERLYFYSRDGNKYTLYQGMEVSSALGLKQGSDGEIMKPKLKHLVLLSCLMPPGADNYGVLLKRKNGYVSLLKLKP